MDPEKSYIPHPEKAGKAALAPGTGGSYQGGLRPGKVFLRSALALYLSRYGSNEIPNPGDNVAFTLTNDGVHCRDDAA